MTDARAQEANRPPRCHLFAEGGAVRHAQGGYHICVVGLQERAGSFGRRTCTTRTISETSMQRTRSHRDPGTPACRRETRPGEARTLFENRRLPLRALKVAAVLFMFLWIRATFPRYRYDQIMRLGWKVFIPVTLVWIVFLGVMMQTRWAYLFH